MEIGSFLVAESTDYSRVICAERLTESWTSPLSTALIINVGITPVFTPVLHVHEANKSYTPDLCVPAVCPSAHASKQLGKRIVNRPPSSP